jgi:predicted nucleic acid-binding protein
MSEKKVRIYLDNCCFNRPYDDQNDIKIKVESISKLYIQEQIKNNKIDLIWSYILEFENDQNPYKDKLIAIEKWKNLSIVNINESDDIIVVAENLVKIGIKDKDALHISCALNGGCDYLITTDNGILKKSKLIKNISILNPVDFIAIMEES